MYLTHDEYTGMGGSHIAAALFDRLELRARNFIDRMTRGRISGEAPVRGAVKCCMVELVNAMAEDDAHHGREVSHMSNDGAAMTFAGAQQDPAARYAGIVRIWLICEKDARGVGLMYSGVD